MLSRNVEHVASRLVMYMWTFSINMRSNQILLQVAAIFVARITPP
jgi:hypothetical protein